MKRWKYFLFSLVPTVYGYLANTAVFVPFLGSLLLLAAPLLAAAFCLWLGRSCARNNISLFPALLLTQWLNILSLILYVWQVHFCDDTSRSVFWAVLSQCPAICFSILASRVTWMFVFDNTWGPSETLLMIGLSVCLLLIFFLCGYLLGKRAPVSPS